MGNLRTTLLYAFVGTVINFLLIGEKTVQSAKSIAIFSKLARLCSLQPFVKQVVRINEIKTMKYNICAVFTYFQANFVYLSSRF